MKMFRLGYSSSKYVEVIEGLCKYLDAQDKLRCKRRKLERHISYWSGKYHYSERIAWKYVCLYSYSDKSPLAVMQDIIERARSRN